MAGYPFLRGDEVVLRTVGEDDLEFLRRWKNDPRVRRAMTRAVPQSLESERQDFARHSASDSGVGLLVCVGGEPVGLAVLFDIDGTAGRGELAYWIAPDERRQGYAADAVGTLVEYAFRERRLAKLRARVLADNAGSQAVLEKLGFEREGLLRGQKFAGESVDVYRYGLDVRTWRSERDGRKR